MVIALLYLWGGFGAALFALILPFTIASALGAYLFYAQHTYEQLRILPAEDWSYSEAALESSSYMKMDPVMSWLTGNIGYHHIHHLNPQVPFYRLPEAMGGISRIAASGCYDVASSRYPGLLSRKSLGQFDSADGQLPRNQRLNKTAGTSRGVISGVSSFGGVPSYDQSCGNGVP